MADPNPFDPDPAPLLCPCCGAEIVAPRYVRDGAFVCSPTCGDHDPGFSEQTAGLANGCGAPDCTLADTGSSYWCATCGLVGLRR